MFSYLWLLNSTLTNYYQHKEKFVRYLNYCFSLLDFLRLDVK